AYTRQFLDLLDKPRVDAIENIRPSIAIEQSNTVKTSRSTVGTMTELTDFAKVWFSHVAECFDPVTGEKVEDDTPATIWQKTHVAHPAATLLLCFRVAKPDNLEWTEVLTSIKGQGYTRVLVPAQRSTSNKQRSTAGDIPLGLHKIDDLLTALSGSKAERSKLDVERWTFVQVIQDRLLISADNQARFLEATETALHFGKGEIHLFAPLKSEVSNLKFTEAGHYSRGLHSPKTGRTFRPATPGLFSFNSPLGACPRCRGFGRVIDIDYRLAIPDHSLSIADGAIRPWEGEIYGESKKDLIQFAKKFGLPVNVPFAALTPAQKSFVIDGSPGYDGETNHWPKYWYGLKGFFRYLEKTTYKMHVRVFLSRYRAYNTCPDCAGARLQPEALCWKWRGYTLPQLYQLPISELLGLIQSDVGGVPPPRENAASHHQRDLAHDSIVTRLHYLSQVGLGYLTLDRTSRTLSGGEVQRVNLTSCLGTSLVDTLFVLDEPSVGLHPRDIDRLLGIIRTLTDSGNTVVVVEHDEAMIRAADHVIEIGPEPGVRGGNIVFQGSVTGLLASSRSITGAYFSGRQRIDLPAQRRPVDPSWRRDYQSRGLPAAKAMPHGTDSPASTEADTKWLSFTNATKHNVRNLSFRLPLQRLVCLSGVSGSGKSTLLDNIIAQGLLTRRSLLTEDPAEIEAITSDLAFSEIVLVDQSPLSRTPRSNPALYCEAWELIRELYAAVPAAQEAGFSASSFSFNSGDGRCDNCQGLGSERVEMQFLSDVFVPCPICEGRRFKPEVLAITWSGQSIADLLAMNVADALELFAGPVGGVPSPRGDAATLATIRSRLAALDEVGLGYLPLGQPLNTLSGGESQRLKLVRYLSDFTADRPDSDPQVSGLRSQVSSAGALLLLDEPTTGLHRHDVKRLLDVLQRIVDRGHSVVVIEHNLDVLKSADWILEVGPEAGAAGGRIVAAGPPEAIARAATATSPFLRGALKVCHIIDDKLSLAAAEDAAPYGAQPSALSVQPLASSESGEGGSCLTVLGARENNLKNISVSIPHRQLSVVTGVSGSG
ncbi:MAG: ATP-binding cassette domain-containing protein, partial [Opitutae bacterium]|nr:ATP-binding cassette domain-containing protein [Opitutae bacterium]